VREKGKLVNLRTLLKETPIHGSIGIGHTRWATHGAPSRENAHPHYDQEQNIVVVHNGIIENHEELKQKLLAKGSQFKSETDTEILTHLIGFYHSKQNLSLKDAVLAALKEISGAYAFCVISKKEKGVLVAARQGSPLVVGVTDKAQYIASDAPAIADYTRDVIFLEDNQLAVLHKDKVEIFDLEGHVVEWKTTKIDWDSKSVTKEGFDHFMLKEIEEQPKVFEDLFKRRCKNGLEDMIFDRLDFDESYLRDVSRITIQACGTSWHAALTAKFLIETLAHIPTEVDVSSEFRYRALIPQEKCIALAITQSGETVDTLMGMRQAKAIGHKTLAICNVLGSTIARESNGVIYTHAGPEIGVASTKAYTAQLGVLICLSLYWARIRKTLTQTEINHYIEEMRLIPEKMRKIISQKDQIKKIAEKYYQSRDFLFLGRGINYPNAHEGALKIKEVAYLHATGHPAGEMKHGPIALIDEHMPVVCIAPDSSVYGKMESNIQEVKARAGKVIAIVTEGDKGLENFVDDFIEIPRCPELLSPLLVTLPMQYLAYYVAVLRGTDVDQPRNLAKSVTVE
jgi:glucosamine--fructose-6-phosphate aminotransferase (isomerizing)